MLSDLDFNIFDVSDIKSAYLKFKSFQYHASNTDIHTREKLINFEYDYFKSSTNSIEKFEILKNKINEILSNEAAFDKKLENIKYRRILKKIKPDINGIPNDNVICNITDLDNDVSADINLFIEADIEIHLISTLWVLYVGKLLDQNLSEDTYGYRLDYNQNGNFKTRHIYKPYYNEYQNWRDNSIKKTKDIALSRKKDVVMVSLDIKKFFYNISIDYNKINTLINKKNISKSEVLKLKVLNDVIKKINDSYFEKIKEICPETPGVLPIGLISSPILANWHLEEFDRKMKCKGLNYYGRYIDDILIVFSSEIIDVKENDIFDFVIKTLENKNIIENSSDDYYLKTSNTDITKIIQKEKIKIYFFKKNSSLALLEKFQEILFENSSLFNFFPEEDSIFLES